MAAFPVYVVLMRDAFEVKVEKRLSHVSAPQSLGSTGVATRNRLCVE